MAGIPLTKFERLADEATKMVPFRVNLSKVRHQVEAMLSEWKNSGVFQEYTDHSFNHVIDMLEVAEWIIPDSTQAIMTSGDWVTLVLSTYFHDLGLLVSKSEYENRANNPEFQSFRASPILPAEKHKEYMARLGQLEPEEAERIQYQEFVRANHGKRVRAWIEGSGTDDEGSTATIKAIVIDLLRDLDDTFRSDLAAVCESHTLGHLEAVADLGVSVPYGGGKQGEVNLRYIAIILRTIDLVQITKKRAPSVLLQLISPSNPTSQVEWQKQEAVRDVRPSPRIDGEGNVSSLGTSNAIEVYATFKQPNGFFGLTSYLQYASKEIAASYALVTKSRREVEKSYEFPWEYIDDRGIKADGFMTRSFQFNLDQRKILDLLTGHTLYNNSTVVLRELTQNALDAVRLQKSLNQESEYIGDVSISWDSKDKILVIQDTGTGMSQDIVERHLLTVGSSRYQDPEFVDKHPTFHSISRFGIGVLSTFMVSDDVEITTCSVDEDKARRIALQSVHGKYLIKLLDKEKDRLEIPVYPHGTSVRVKLRPTANYEDVAAIVKSWVVFPRCNVTVKIDDHDAFTVGYNSPREAVEEYVDHLRSLRSKTEYRVEEYSEGGLTLAFALSKSDLFQDWNFVSAQRGSRYEIDRNISVPTSTCIEGVAVEQNTPGFQTVGILAVANAIGKNAPKTNVARSALEDTGEHREMVRTLYRLYGQHVDSEISRLAGVKGNSLSRAVGFAPYIMSPLSSYANTPTKRDLLDDALASVPIALVEQDGKRSNVSLGELAKTAPFITVESPLNRSIEYFIREAPNDLTSHQLMDILGNSGSQPLQGPVLCNQSSFYIQNKIHSEFDVVRVDASAETRSLILYWNSKKVNEPRWFTADDIYGDLLDSDQHLFYQLNDARSRLTQTSTRQNLGTLVVPLGTITTNNLDNYGGFSAGGSRYLQPTTPLAVYLAELYLDKRDVSIRKLAISLLFLDAVRASYSSWDILNNESASRIISGTNFAPFRGHLDLAQLVPAIAHTNPVFFDSYAWDRRSEEAVI
jgi:molecular chaperone HtpG